MMLKSVLLFVCSCFLAIVLFVGVQSVAAQPLTNTDVVKLSSLGLGDDVIIAKIKQAPSVSFSLEVADLEKLKKDGVSKAVIAAMLQRTTATGSAAAEPIPAASTLDVWTVAGGKRVEIPSVAGYTEASVGQAFKQAFLFSLKNKVAMIAKGTTAKTRFAAAPSTLYTRYKPSEIGVAKLTVQSDKDRRYVWLVSRRGSDSWDIEPAEDDMKFTDERASDGTYKITFKAPLGPGEYALIAPGGSTGNVLHEFVVEEK